MSDPHGHLRLRYEGRFVFSKFPRGHVSWCHLKVIQGQHKTLVIFAHEEDNPGTFIANAVGLLATQVANLFGLVPESTLFLERTPPVDEHAGWRQWATEDLSDHDFSLPILTLFGTNEDTYERISFEWSESSDYDEPRYTAHCPTWEVQKPIEVIRQFQDL